MSKKAEVSPLEDTNLLKPQTWIFDERMGWVDVKEFLIKVRKMSETSTVNLDKPGKDKLAVLNIHS